MDARRKIASDDSQTDEAFVAAIEEARAQVDAGKTVSYEEVRRWLLSWGTETELPRPKCK
jgi:predicted transcriptional regulator